MRELVCFLKGLLKAIDRVGTFLKDLRDGFESIIEATIGWEGYWVILVILSLIAGLPLIIATFPFLGFILLLFILVFTFPLWYIVVMLLLLVLYGLIKLTIVILEKLKFRCEEIEP